MAVSGTLANYNSEPRLRTLYSNNIISPVAGANPVDSGYVVLPNVRGQISVVIISGDNSFMSSFNIVGGFGSYSTDPTQNWYPQTFSYMNCVVTQLMPNIFQIQTPVADAGGRTYIMQFFPVQSMGPQIRQTSLNIIGNNTLNVRLIKNEVLPGGW